MTGKGAQKQLSLIPDSALGVLREDNESHYSELPPEAKRMTLTKHILTFAKTNSRSTIHSSRYVDYIGIKQFNKRGQVIGEFRFIGLYTWTAYHSNTLSIPILRLKVKKVLEQSGLPHRGHASKTLLNILETLPRDILFQASTDKVFELTMGIFRLQNRRIIRLFVYKDPFKRYVSCFVYVPKDDYNTELRYRIEEILMQALHGTEVSFFDTRFSDSLLARLFFEIRLDPQNPPAYDLKELEKKLMLVGKSWRDNLQEDLLKEMGDNEGRSLYLRYKQAFPAGYREAFSPSSTVSDIEHMEKLSPHNLLEMNLYKPFDVPWNMICFKLFRAEHTIPLSDVMPILENLGMRVIGEQPYEIVLTDGSDVWINDFSMLYSSENLLDIEKNKQNFQEAFNKIWHGEAENDGFNHLVLAAELSWREVSVIRAYAKYLKQLGSTFSQAYMEDTLTRNPIIASLLVNLFKNRFDPKLQDVSEQTTKEIEDEIQRMLESVANLDEDRILRMFLNVIKATVRTNYYQTLARKHPKPYLSFKFNSAEIQDIPLPRPLSEIFVYSPRLEGIHLRMGKVARGGIRWSDRREDFRTEVLGLMKAQQVKNAIIVPAGAKGGFVPKALTPESGREAILEEAMSCYRNFIRGLLDLVDNLQGNKVVHPENTVYYDSDDTYLVVAADKGTATFSDIANEIAKEYQFWLGDAFASGGSTGYDHKKMAITARGAWESVKYHFQELGTDIQKQDFTVVGIGDMAGDVFGNGMLLSKHTKLVGAFNHQHIFVDPDPDPAESFKERQRLFNLPRSTWEDYNSEIMSKGAGIFKRSAKAIKLSPEIKNLLLIKKDIVTPNELIRALLKAPVDLLWNGGIGTFVKASFETNADAADRANDAIRINADELSCRVVGEGGNLGFTQLARIEYDLNGGKIYTDFIDNSGGVDCSDHEVNIKILLNMVMEKAELTEKQRNALLVQMTDEVSHLVLHNNYRQARAISLGAQQSYDYVSLYIRYINDKVREHKIDRYLEFLPEDKTMLERKANGKGLTCPEIAVLSAYGKIMLKEDILNSDLHKDPSLTGKYVELAFPKILRKRYPEEMKKHRLYREIIATQLSNTVITDMGVTFVYQMYDETRATSPDIVRGYVISSEIFHMPEFYEQVAALDNKIPADLQTSLVLEMVRLVRRATRWFLRNQRPHLDIKVTTDLFSHNAEKIFKNLPDLLMGSDKEYFENKKIELISAGVPEELAARIAGARAMYSALNIIEAATEYRIDVQKVASIYFSLADLLALDQFREMINNFSVDTHWSVLARSAVKGDLDWQQRILTIGVLKDNSKLIDTEKLLSTWLDTHKTLVERWQTTFSDLRSSVTLEYAMLAVAMRELLDLAQASLYGTHMNNNTNNSKYIVAKSSEAV
jgi:glutamate dehydrogenase